MELSIRFFRRYFSAVSNILTYGLRPDPSTVIPLLNEIYLPYSDPGPVEAWAFVWLFAKIDSAFHPYEHGKMTTSLF